MQPKLYNLLMNSLDVYTMNIHISILTEKKTENGLETKLVRRDYKKRICLIIDSINTSMLKID